MTATAEVTDVSTDRQLKLRCFEISLQIRQQESMHRIQAWQHLGRNGEPPQLHTRDEVYEDAARLYDFVSEDE
tara:strand:+ start:131 stop:349 length:219 start_codon:yes stop_codon:yes gene_type:complete